MRGVILRQVGVCLGIAQVVDGYDFNIVLFATFVMCAQNVATNTTITVNSDANCHETKLLSLENL